MILTLDIGNTNMKTALFDGEEMKQYWRLSTNRNRTSDEYGMALMNLMNHNGIQRGQVGGEFPDLLHFSVGQEDGTSGKKPSPYFPRQGATASVLHLLYRFRGSEVQFSKTCR